MSTIPLQNPVPLGAQWRASARQALITETQGMELLVKAIDGPLGEAVAKAVDLIRKSRGRVILSGMGKSGHVCRKIASTLASTGTPAMFVHPAEASHGDLGMVTIGDVVLAISNSGNTAELITLLPLLKRLRVPVIGMTGNTDSLLAKTADVN